ncbi:MAG: CapA family protein [Angelakisella sp.]|nr:CapA family protein [Angelakisella sp.]
MMKRKNRLLALGAALLLLFGCAPAEGSGSSAPLPPQEPAVFSAPDPEPPEPVRAVLVAVGDNLIHDVIYQQARQRAGGEGYDFAPAYEKIAPLVAQGDFAFINQETLLAGDELPPSSYPAFCSPTEVGREMLRLGFNLFSTANNHSLDWRVPGIQAAGRFWEQQEDIAMAGCYCTQEEREGIAYLTRNGMTVALIAATELTNGIPRPEGEVGVLLLNEDRELILQKLETAAQNADFVILSLHWGIEGSGYYTDGQRELAQLLAEAGADLILGHHPHVLQGGEYLETSRGRSYVAYSLGNFISAQRGAENMLAGFLQVELEKAPHGERAEIRGVDFIPTVTHYGPGYQEVSVWPLSQYTPELAAAHGVRQYAPAFGWDYLTEQLAGLDFQAGGEPDKTSP